MTQFVMNWYSKSDCVYKKSVRNLEYNKKHLKNVGSIRHCEPPHADVHNNNNNNNA